MSRTIPLSGLLVAALLIVGFVTVGAVVSADDTTHTLAGGHTESQMLSNTTNYAYPTPADNSRQGYVRSNVDVAGAIATDVERLEGQLSVSAFEHQYERRNTSQARLDLVEASIERAEQRLGRLDTQQETVFRSYSNGAISEETFLRRLARLETSAEQSRTLLDNIDSQVRSDSTTTFPIPVQTRLAALQAELVTLPSPLSSRIVGTVQGDAKPVTVYAEGAGSGLVLATVDENSFVRESTLRTAYTPGEPNQFAQSDNEPISVAFSRTQTLYPWVADNLQSINRIAGFGDSDVYLIDLSHPQGDMRAYIHGGSTDVFREIHTQRPETVPKKVQLSNETDGLTLQVNATAETGPMRISVTSSETDTPTAADIRINGQRIGSTGNDGSLWAIRPSGLLRVNATAGETSVVVSS